MLRVVASYAALALENDKNGPYIKGMEKPMTYLKLKEGWGG